MKKIFFAICFLINGGFTFAGDWQPIIGIPEPPFGISEDVNILYGPGSGATYDYSDDDSAGDINWSGSAQGAIPYRTDSNGEPYTYYVSPGDPNATNTNNPHGTEAMPRISFPLNIQSLSPGDVVMLVGTAPGGSTLRGNGTPVAPIFIRGAADSKPVHSAAGGFFVDGSFYIFENIKFDWKQGTNPRVYLGLNGVPVTHIAIRNCEFYNGWSAPNTSYQAIRSKLDDGTPDLVQNLIIYNNSFHDCGEDNTSDFDVSSVSIDANTKYVWIIYNEIYRIGGDGIQISWDGYVTSTNMPQYIYIGKNISHDMYENFLDLKMCQDVIVSQNTVYNIGETYSDVAKFDRRSIPIRYGLGEGPDDVGRKNVWTLFNVVYNFDTADGAFSSFTGQGETLADEIYYIGNIAYNGHAPAYGDATAFYSSGQANVYWLNNTSYNCDRAGFFIGDYTGTISEEKITLMNNIFGYNDASSTQPYALQIGGTPASLDRAQIRNNIFFNTNGIAKYRVGVWNPSPAIWTTYLTYSAFHSAYPDFFLESTEENPLHIDEVNGDFKLSPSSPAVNAGTLHNAYTTFQSRYGISIQVDFENRSVPYGIALDIGAYEYSPSEAPRNLRIVK